MRLGEARRWIGTARDTRPWRRGRPRLLLRQALGPAPHSERDDREHLAAAASWLAAAQDSQRDGGIAGRYRLKSGWSSSYPETTGYAIPTLLALARQLGDERWRERAAAAIGFLRSIQLESGGFPGLEIADNASEPSAFNTAQIIHGLLAWHRATGDPAIRDAALRAGEWLLSIQEPDGSWVRHCFEGVASDYAAHLSCRLAELGDYTGDRRFLDSAARHLDWVLGHADRETGWFQRAGFSPEQHAAGESFTHTIAYTIWGVLFSSEILGREDGIAAAARAARAVARRLELRHWLPGVLDARWRARTDAACLTGNCQMALIWLRLYERTGDATLLNAALEAIDLVKDTQVFGHPDPGIRGGIAGSYPVWGEYITNALPNWAAKYFIDALLAKEAVLSRIERRPKGRHPPSPRLPRNVPAAPVGAAARPQRIVLLTSAASGKAPRLLEGWQEWGFTPAAVVVERGAAVPKLRRVAEIIGERGVAGIVRTVAQTRRTGRRNSGPSADRGDAEPVLAYCARRGIRAIEVETVNSPAAVAAVAALGADLLVHAGAGLLRRQLLALPRLGTINAHMGLLPFYRGMNTAEWAAFNGDPVGCTVHLIDLGIDTGDILVVRTIDASGASDASGAAGIGSLRAAVDRAQIELLGEVVRYVWATGELPPLHPQRGDEGCQFFAMHPELRRRLEIELAAAARTRAPGAAGSAEDREHSNAPHH